MDMTTACEEAAKALARYMIAHNAWQLDLMDKGEWGTTDDENRKPPKRVAVLAEKREETRRRYLGFYNRNSSVDIRREVDRTIAGRAAGIMARSLARVELDTSAEVPLIGLSKWGD